MSSIARQCIARGMCLAAFWAAIRVNLGCEQHCAPIARRVRIAAWLFASCQTALAIYQSYYKKIGNALKYYAKIHQNSTQIHAKLTKMVPRSTPKVILEASRFPGPQKVSAPDAFFESFCDTCAISDAILGPTGRQGAPQIEHFGTKTRQNVKK